MKSVINILQSASGVTSLLANGSSSIYDDIATQSDSVPYIVVDESQLTPMNTFGTTAPMDEIMVNVFCISDRKNTAGGVTGTEAVALAVRTAMEGVSGTYATESIKDIMLETESNYHERFGDKVLKVKEQTYQIFRDT